MELSLQERRSKILEILYKEGKVKVGDLSKLFDVSEVSIRTDLSELESQGLLSRVHGGALSSYKSYYNMSLGQRSSTNQASKQQIAKKIAGMIDDNDTVLMNAGTTPIFVMRELLEKRGITIVTNSIALALEGAQHKNLHIILLGGEVNADYQFTYGTTTLRLLHNYYVDKLVLSADGINAEKGITTYYAQEAEISNQMIQQAGTAIAAMDYTKIGRVAFAGIADAECIHYLVTNQSAPKDDVAELKSKGLNVILA